MKRFEWTEEYSVGDPDIDEDHRGLFELIERLQHAPYTDELIAEIIGELEDYARHHFAREEELMARVGYPGLDAHAREHREFVEWLDTVKSTYRRAAESPFEVGDVVNTFLKRWLTRHIMEQDMKYRDYIVGGD